MSALIERLRTFADVDANPNSQFLGFDSLLEAASELERLGRIEVAARELRDAWHAWMTDFAIKTEVANERIRRAEDALDDVLGTPKGKRINKPQEVRS